MDINKDNKVLLHPSFSLKDRWNYTEAIMTNMDIYIIFGDQPRDMIRQLLSTIKIENTIDKHAKIGIKPNLVLASPSSLGATTDPEIVAAVIEYLQGVGFKDICILEGSWIGDRTARAFKVCGYEDISKKYNVPLYDLQQDTYKSYDVGGIELNVCDKVMDIDYLINMPVLKGHCQTRITCSLKNLKGCIPNTEKRKFHTMGLHKPIAYLSKVIKSDLILVDGIVGDLNFEEGGNPVQMNRIIAGQDPILVDAYVTELLGYDVSDVEYIEIADRIGVGSSDVESANIVELNKDNLASKRIEFSRRIQYLASYVDERDACSACYGSLIHALDRLDDKGKLAMIDQKIHIGQAYKGVEVEGIGVGSCTRDCDKSLLGCPPKAKDIIGFLEDVY